MAQQVFKFPYYQCKEKAFLLVELLVLIVLISIVSIGLAGSSIVALKLKHQAINVSYANQLALEKLEELSAVNPADWNDGDIWNETVEIDGREFTRIATVTVNDDGSRTVEVTVTATSAIGGSVTMDNTYFMWGSS